MTKNSTEILIQKYLNAETTPEEERRLALEVSREDAPDEWKLIAEMLGELTVDEALYDQILEERKAAIKPKSSRKLWPWLVAACVAGIIALILAPPKRLESTTSSPQFAEQTSQESDTIRTSKPKELVVENVPIEKEKEELIAEIIPTTEAKPTSKQARKATQKVEEEVVEVSVTNPDIIRDSDTLLLAEHTATTNIKNGVMPQAEELQIPQDRVITERDIPITRPENLKYTKEELALMKQQANEAYRKWIELELEIAKYNIESTAER